MMFRLRGLVWARTRFNSVVAKGLRWFWRGTASCDEAVARVLQHRSVVGIVQERAGPSEADRMAGRPVGGRAVGGHSDGPQCLERYKEPSADTQSQLESRVPTCDGTDGDLLTGVHVDDGLV
jgi:hypothetical protein